MNTNSELSPTEASKPYTFRMAWGSEVPPEFRDRVVEICKQLGWDSIHASWLMSCIAFETGETFSASIMNAAGSGAVGLIQFMPNTARGLGTTTAELSQMSEVDQLEYVGKYFRPYAKHVNALEDMYMAILLPKYIKAPGNTVIFSSGISYRQNAGLDADKDGKITKNEATKRVRSKYVKGTGMTAEVQW